VGTLSIKDLEEINKYLTVSQEDES
jgi:hypothetical protein